MCVKLMLHSTRRFEQHQLFLWGPLGCCRYAGGPSCTGALCRQRSIYLAGESDQTALLLQGGIFRVHYITFSWLDPLCRFRRSQYMQAFASNSVSPMSRLSSIQTVTLSMLVASPNSRTRTACRTEPSLAKPPRSSRTSEDAHIDSPANGTHYQHHEVGVVLSSLSPLVSETYLSPFTQGGTTRTTIIWLATCTLRPSSRSRCRRWLLGLQQARLGRSRAVHIGSNAE